MYAQNESAVCMIRLHPSSMPPEPPLIMFGGFSMRKFTAFLLTLALFLPALALAEDVPTFDFTAEEWLENYKTVVPQEKPWYFEEYELTGGKDTHYMYRHDFKIGRYNGNVELRCKKREDNVYAAYIAIPLSVNSFSDISAIADDLALSFDMANDFIHASFPELTDAQLQSILAEFNTGELTIYDLDQKMFSTNVNGVYYTYAPGSAISITISTTPYEDAMSR